MDLQDQQEDRLAHRVDGGGEGALEDLPALPTYVLATGIQGELHHPSCYSHRYHPDVYIKGADLNERPGGVDEHGGEVAAEDRLRTRCCC